MVRELILTVELFQFFFSLFSAKISVVNLQFDSCGATILVNYIHVVISTINIISYELIVWMLYYTIFTQEWMVQHTMVHSEKNIHSIWFSVRQNLLRLWFWPLIPRKEFINWCNLKFRSIKIIKINLYNKNTWSSCHSWNLAICSR